MKLSIDTEIEEIEELRHTVAIIEDAIKRREDPESYEDPEAEQAKPPSNHEPEPPVETQPEPQQEAPPEVDMSSLAMSDFGQERESRTLDNLSEQQTSEPQPSVDNKSLIKDIIINIRNQNQGQPIQMTDIITKANEKSIPEEETRNLVNELQKEGTI